MVTKEELKKYKEYLEHEANKFKLKPEDLSNLFDLFYMLDWRTYEDLRLNKMQKWFQSFFERLEKIVITELHKK